MIGMNIESLMVGFPPMPSIVTLRPVSDSEDAVKAADIPADSVLPIVVGVSESSAIAAALEERQPMRPLTHETANNLLRALGGSVSRVIIDRVDGSTFFATVYLRCANGMFTRVDARPSDAIALAIRANAPLFVEESVLQAAGAPRSFAVPGGDHGVEMEEFHKFVEDVKPEDFVTHGGETDKKKRS